MLIRRIAIENVRSFLERQELVLDGDISIIIGPNGGGKTNLLDTVVVMLRRFLLATRYFAPSPTAEMPDRWELRENDQLNQLVLEKHSSGAAMPQIVEVEVEITQIDIANMVDIKSHAEATMAMTKKRFVQDPWKPVKEWAVDALAAGSRVTYTLRDGKLVGPNSKDACDFLSYLQIFEIDNQLRSEIGQQALQLPMVYLPVNRASNGFQSRVSLSGYNDYEVKRASDATSSRGGQTILQLAIGRIAQKFRLLQEKSNLDARTAFNADTGMQELSKELKKLGYEWELKTINALTNEYDISLTKQGTSFLVGAASSGERELLTYLFVVYALNVRHALIVVDEPELHLHPKWQRSLLQLFERLSQSTGNQFILATHSPTFVSPSSIQYISRVYSISQRSQILRLNSRDLPNAKHLFNIVNAQNNESVFFCDEVILVEGISDRIFFERIFELVLRRAESRLDKTIEIVPVGGKGLFSAYQKLLQACGVKTKLIADRDYLEQIGDSNVKSLFVLNASEIKRDVIDNVSSLDGASLVARIDEAMTSGNWQDAEALWDYIKSRRRQLPAVLGETESEMLRSFLRSKADDGVFVLERGALEDYLPVGYRSKDMEKFIEVMRREDLWELLPQPGRDEIEGIVKRIVMPSA